MARNHIDMPMSEVMKAMTWHVRFTGVPVARARLWVAAQVFKLGAAIAGCGIEIESQREKND